MADAETAKLCVQIIDSHFGPLTASLVSTLLARGRLSLPQLIRFTDPSPKPRSVHAAVLSLIQHNLLWHSVDDAGGQEMLEVNTFECFMRLRFGRFVALADDLFGSAGTEIVQLVLDHGKVRPPDIISQLSQGDKKNTSAYKQTLHKLVDRSYLKPSTVLSHQSPHDKLIAYDAEERRRIAGFPTAKQLREARETAEARLKREEEEAERVGFKRKAKDNITQRSSKRKAVDEDALDDDVYFRVNYDKFNIHIRNQLIETLVRERFNESAACVVHATLKSTELKQKSMTDVRSDPTSTASIAMHIPDDAPLSAGLASSSKKSNPASLAKEFLTLMSSSANPSAASFVSMGENKVYVEFETISRRMKRHVLEEVTREKHKDEGVRILRLLLDVGKMDEKQIAKVAMLPSKDLRPLLSALSSDFIISTQEVPRSADRNPTRTFYLWYVDLNRAYTSILRSLYKTLFNIGLRRSAEAREPNVAAVLVKRERTDVAADEVNLLTRLEREILNSWEARRERLTILEARVEEAVFILRDLVCSEES
ncbi:hypothetical protein CONPUDRAFT_118168 [Coniophora puteana RWD-64-598 SS2]|uniref:DNA-directed RNA polymerase III subunit RPC3 n=1 Tax=Coniophora puteana (strain RWD-64-598) TaxID=741705 RepID=A0A5M3N1V0_CONPW|nr:uncharacterized protein CONPUDRAFT_118168 [Coniophora puteana RWD-64-598 SS2]EIW85372.1 hypothetical protein CONPUDRAFT_118168 [Coniophora puteana RWD-64-598 SS2]